MPSFPRSLPRICVALGLSTPAELARAAEREYKDGSTLLEFRLDYLADPFTGIPVLQHLLANYPDASILATCRLKQNHGNFAGSVETQLAVLREAAKNGAAAVDLEIETAENVKPALIALRDSAPLIVSYHNFETTPALAPLLRRLQHIPADAYKIATTARKPADNLRLIQFAREHRDLSTKANRDTPLIALAMSTMGLPTRILGPSLGCLFTYAAPSEQEGTAPGQISARNMRTLFRADKIGKSTRLYGVIADPVGHSKSPAIHNRAFQARRIDAAYLPFCIPATQLSEWMKMAAALPVAGFSVTIPHKQRILRYLDVVDPLAKRIGAVNTVWRKAGKWRGTNTDTQGVLKPLQRHIRLAHASVLIAGYGGAARAAAFALADAGANVTITGRNLASAQSLAQVVKAEALSLADAQQQRFDVLLNATPLGMHPKINESLFNGKLPASLVFDMVYNPHETLLLQQAKAQNCTVIHGSEMLLEQAAAQFEIWTGESAPHAVMEAALEQASS